MSAILATAVTIASVAPVTGVLCAVRWRGKTCEYCQLRLGWLIVERTRHQHLAAREGRSASRFEDTDKIPAIGRVPAATGDRRPPSLRPRS